mmetsp:Transcript_20326/g.17374  ORF Transcript_20326/g.17374 Transcript_20326/m.17374 type:complete len:210 (+) Transcript_20326:3-632(+)
MRLALSALANVVDGSLRIPLELASSLPIDGNGTIGINSTTSTIVTNTTSLSSSNGLVSLPLSNVFNMYYYGSVLIDGQLIRVMFDTGSGVVWVPSVGSKGVDCENQHRCLITSSSDDGPPDVIRQVPYSYGSGKVLLNLTHASVSLSGYEDMTLNNFVLEHLVHLKLHHQLLAIPDQESTKPPIISSSIVIDQYTYFHQPLLMTFQIQF